MHALLGENGAGKTTLSHVLTGLYRPDAGEILLWGEPVRFASPRQAIDAGVCMVHQQFRLVERFTVAENIILGDTRGAGRHLVVDPRAVEGQVRELGERYGLPVDPHARIWQLSVGERQRVEILKALYQDARILILDEPTAVLTPGGGEHALRDAARDGGRGPHGRLHLAQAARGDGGRGPRHRPPGGRLIATVPTAGATPASLAALMVGHDVATAHRAAAAGGVGAAGARGRGALGRRRPRTAGGEGRVVLRRARRDRGRRGRRRATASAS